MKQSNGLIIISLTLVWFITVYFYVFESQIGAPTRAEYWLRDVIKLKSDIIRNTQERKIVLIGGSSTLFGYDSEKIEQSTGFKTVNFGLHVLFPLDYLIDLTIPHLVPGDIVIMQLELEYFETDRRDNQWFYNQIMSWDTDYYYDLNILQKLDFMFSVAPRRVVTGLLAKRYRHFLMLYGRGENDFGYVMREVRRVWDGTRKPDNVYSVLNISKHGDILTNYDLRYWKSPVYSLNKPLNEKVSVWSVLQNFSQYCENNNIKLYITWPALLDSKPLREVPQAHNKLSAIRQKMTSMGLTALGNPEELRYERLYFSDTKYHLNHEGRQRRTDALLFDLNKAMNPGE